MATDKQFTANRANAKKSTGPKTDSGKQISRRNALKHGLTSEAIVIGDEDPTNFEELRAGFEEDFQPETAVQYFLVERLAADAFRLLRIPVFEAAYIDFCYEEGVRASTTLCWETRFASGPTTMATAPQASQLLGRWRDG